MNAAWAATFRPVLQPKSGTEPGDASEVVFSESVSGDAAEVFKPWLDTVWDGEWLMTTSLKVKDGASVVIGRADEIYVRVLRRGDAKNSSERPKRRGPR